MASSSTQDGGESSPDPEPLKEQPTVENPGVAKLAEQASAGRNRSANGWTRSAAMAASA
jgi:hypothetical protein